MWLTAALLVGTSLVQPSLQQYGNSTAPFPAATYPNATAPDPAAQGNAEFSPPYYPSPWGSGAGEWASAYAKAQAFVSQLTLLEKVNLTTGVGYVQYYLIDSRLESDFEQVAGRTLRRTKWGHPASGLPKYVHARFASGRQRHRLQLGLPCWCQCCCDLRSRSRICERPGYGCRTSDERVRCAIGTCGWTSWAFPGRWAKLGGL